MTKELTTTKTFAPFFRDYMDYYEEMSKGDWYEFTGLVFNACFKGIYPDVEAIKKKGEIVLECRKVAYKGE